MSDALIAELRKALNLATHKCITCGVAASHPDPKLTTTGAYATKWDSQQAQQVRALREERDRLRAALTAAVNALYNPFEPDNQSRAWHAGNAALGE